MTKFVNCTPHAITVRGLGVLLTSGIIPRCATVRKEENPVGGIRVVRQSFGDVVGLPEPEADTIFVVSGMVLSALNGARADVVAPDTGSDAVRDNGQIVEVLGFVC